MMDRSSKARQAQKSQMKSEQKIRFWA